MQKFLMMAILTPWLAYGMTSPMIDIKVQVVKVDEIPGLYLLKWDGTYWAQLEVLEYCEEGDVTENQYMEPLPERAKLPEPKREIDLVDSKYYLD